MAGEVQDRRLQHFGSDGLVIVFGHVDALRLGVQGTVQVGQGSVPLAVRTKALQPFRDFTVVYAKVGHTYEVRMLDLGRRTDEWTEVLGGLEPGTEYVVDGAFLIRADIEKSGASHDH